MWRGAAVHVIELALVAVGALLLVGAVRGQVSRAPALAEEVLQGGTVPHQRVVRRHKAIEQEEGVNNSNNDAIIKVAT